MQNRIISVGIVDGSIVVTYQDGSTEILGPVGDLDPEELQEAVRRNSGDIAGVKRDIAALQQTDTGYAADIDQLKSDRTEMRGDISDLEEEVADLKADYDDLKGVLMQKANQTKTEHLRSEISDVVEWLPKEVGNTGNFIIYTGDELVADIVLNGPVTGQYDGMAVLDGVNLAISGINGQSTYFNHFIVTALNKAFGVNNFVCDWLETNSNIHEAVNGRANNANLEIILSKTRCGYSVDDANRYFMSHPLRIWYATPTASTATKFYQYIKSISDGVSVNLGTLEPVLPLQNGETLSFTSGKLLRTNGEISVLPISGSVLDIPNGATIESGNTVTLLLAINVDEELNKKLSEATPETSSFFTRDNWFDADNADVYSNTWCDITGLVKELDGVTSISFPVDPNSNYYLNIPGADRCIIIGSDNQTFTVGTAYPVLWSGGATFPVNFTTGSNTKYVFAYISTTPYDFDNYKNQIILNIGNYSGNVSKNLYIEPIYLPNISPIIDTNILIFGDSITDCCTFSINSNNETTAVVWRNPSNSYVDAMGNTVNYSMWPKIIRATQRCKEIRNYARSGATYKTTQTGSDRQNLQYQIEVALNDRYNPNGVFEVDNFIPDIVIFALGTNDGDPNDTFTSAMDKTVYENDEVTINVDATLAALDDSKFCESARKAFMRIKQAFPTAQMYCVLPIQRAATDTNWGTLREYLSAMAMRYGLIIIDGTADSGITRDFDVAGSLGVYLKDGVHPNEKGQNMMARMIISALHSHYIPFATGFNVLT